MYYCNRKGLYCNKAMDNGDCRMTDCINPESTIVIGTGDSSSIVSYTTEKYVLAAEYDKSKEKLEGMDKDYTNKFFALAIWNIVNSAMILVVLVGLLVKGA